MSDVQRRLDEVVRQLHAKQHGRIWKALCPAHDDSDPSLDIEIGKDGNHILLRCRAGCQFVDIVAAAGIDRSLLGGEGRTVGNSKKVLTTSELRSWSGFRALYVYEDEQTRALFAVLRQTKMGGQKTFPQFRADTADHWVTGLGKTRRVPYRLPQLLGALRRGEDVFVCEGEKDVLNVVEHFHLPATCNPGGAGKWSDEYSKLFAGHSGRVFVMEDNDDAGRAHSTQVAASLAKAGVRDVRILRLPGLPLKGDVSDWIEAGGTQAVLEQLADEAPVFSPPPVNPDELPSIDTQNRPMRDLVADALAAMESRAAKVYVKSGILVYARQDESGCHLEAHNEASLRGVLARVADWHGKLGYHVSPPKDVVQDILHAPDHPFQVVHNVTQWPVFGKDYRVDTTPGYQASPRSYYAPAEGFAPVISYKPTDAQVSTAIDLLRDMLGEFPFADGSGFAHSLAIMLLPLVRRLIDGPTPLFILDKPCPGTGASLLVSAIVLAITGNSVSVLSEAREEDEMRKRITSLLLAGRAFMLLDNVSRRIESPSLCALLTSTWWEDRILGASRIVTLPHFAALMATGNNVRCSDEIARRSVWIQLDSHMERPWERNEFKHPNILGWVKDNRNQLVSAACTLVCAWVAAGRKHGSKSLGSYESWAGIMSGIFENCGITGFLENAQARTVHADEESAMWRAFLYKWNFVHGFKVVAVDELYELARNHELLQSVVGDGEENSRRIKLGRAMGKKVDRVFDGLRICSAGYDSKGRRQYQLAVGGEPQAEPEPAQARNEQPRVRQPVPNEQGVFI